jgi:predicted O-linked N-acetylglucosamine transferase (SPINDLY family)
VLQSVEGSRLIVLAPMGAHRQGILDLLEKDGISAMRIEFVCPCPRAQYLELYHKIDIVLDTWPYNGHTTSLDSLWMGVPVVTQVGQTVVGRAGLSQLMNLGAPELIAKTPDEFVRVARELAGDLARLGELRRTLRDRMRASPLMDGSRFARNIQSVYRQLWQAWCAKQG